ncbi:DMT family transporter [Nocardia yamanashiensis]|uniref:DMT family transporter n=1 Tax=Nocardia yamanashiensis TaxID=209247 RepID=UPI0008309811|nr:DMT family transporter [Nocardia yamanashiensis]
MQLLSVAIMASAPLFNKFGVTAGVGPLWGSVLSAAIGSAGCLAFGLIRKRRPMLIPTAPMLLITAANAAGLTLLYLSAVWLAPAQVGFYSRSYILFATAFSYWLLAERVSAIGGACLLVIVCGGLLFTGSGSATAPAFGVLAVLAYAAFFAMTNVLIKRLAPEQDSNDTLFTINVCTLIPLLPAALLSEGAVPVNGGTAWICLASFLNGFLGLILFYEALKRIPSNEANAIRTISPVLTLVYSAAFYPIALTPAVVAGAVLIVFAAGYLSLCPGAKKPLRPGRRGP